MKLDKIKFARLIAMLASEYGYIHEDFIQAVDNLIDVDAPEQAAEPICPKNEHIEALIKHMVEGTSKLDAIRYHRSVTGMALKESKEVVERHWFPKWTEEQLFVKLTQSSYSADERAAIEHFLQRL